MNKPSLEAEELISSEVWPEKPVPSPDFHRRLTLQLVREGAARRKTRVVRIMRLYWMAAASATLFIVYRLPPAAASMTLLLVAGVALTAPLLLLAPRAIQAGTLGELFLTTIED